MGGCVSKGPGKTESSVAANPPPSPQPNTLHQSWTLSCEENKEKYVQKEDSVSRAEPAVVVVADNIAEPPTPQHQNDVKEVVSRPRLLQGQGWGLETNAKTTPTTPDAEQSPPAMGNSAPFEWSKGDLLGVGTFAKVYAATRPSYGDMIAVKEFRMEGDITKQKLRIVAEEAETMQSIEHPNIVQCLGSQHDLELGVVYVFLELVEHGSIATMLQREGALALSRVKGYTSQIVQALVHLHSLHIIHRDIKGANCLITAHDHIKVADFGSAARSTVGQNTAQLSLDAGVGGTRGMRGTCYFMAPEVIKGAKYGRRSDVWSLGCTVVEMITGRPPWSETGNHVTAMFRITCETEEPPVPQEMDEDGCGFLARCFVRKASSRATAEQLVKHAFVCEDRHVTPVDEALKEADMAMPQSAQGALNMSPQGKDAVVKEASVQRLKPKQRNRTVVTPAKLSRKARSGVDHDHNSPNALSVVDLSD